MFPDPVIFLLIVQAGVILLVYLAYLDKFPRLKSKYWIFNKNRNTSQV